MLASPVRNKVRNASFIRAWALGEHADRAEPCRWLPNSSFHHSECHPCSVEMGPKGFCMLCKHSAN